VKRIATTFARLVGVATLLYGGLILFGNIWSSLTGADYSSFLALLLVLLLAGSGIGGSIIFLLSFDGSPEHRTRGRRFIGWVGMMTCAAMPSSYLFLMGPMVLVGGLTLLIPPDLPARRRGRHLATSS
jgi:hypothetical protein